MKNIKFTTALSTCMREWAAFHKQSRLQLWESTKSWKPETITTKKICCLTFRSSRSLTTRLKFVKRTTPNKFGRHCWTRQFNCSKSTWILICLKTKLRFFSSSTAKSCKTLHQTALLNTQSTYFKQNTTTWTWAAKWLKPSSRSLKTFYTWSNLVFFNRLGARITQEITWKRLLQQA